MSTSEKRDFNKDAATWDDNPARIALTAGVTEALLASVPIASDMSVLDYGAGTGLVTLALAGHAGRVCAADSSEAMLARLREKAEASGLTNVSTMLLDLEESQGDLPYVLSPESCVLNFDIVVCTMVLHHIADAAGVVRKLAACLNSGGCLAIADLDSDNGEFHADPTGVHHHGFERDAVKAFFCDAGLVDIAESTALEFTKDIFGIGTRNFAIFLITGRKS